MYSYFFRFSSNLKGANSTASLSVSAEIMKTIHMQISANSLKDMDAVSKRCFLKVKAGSRGLENSFLLSFLVAFAVTHSFR